MKGHGASEAAVSLKSPSRSNRNTPVTLRLTMIGTRDKTAGSGVASPRMSFASTTLKAGSRVLTVCVREMATAANDKLAAMWPIACIDAGPKMVPNSLAVTICNRHTCM